MDQAPIPLGDWVECAPRPGAEYSWDGHAWVVERGAVLAIAEQALQAECSRRIEVFANPADRELMLGRANELILAHSMGALTDADALELAKLQTAWGKVKDLRAARDVFIGALPALSTEQLALYNAAAQAWPE